MSGCPESHVAPNWRRDPAKRVGRAGLHACLVLSLGHAGVDAAPAGHPLHTDHQPRAGPRRAHDSAVIISMIQSRSQLPFELPRAGHDLLTVTCRNPDIVTARRSDSSAQWRSDKFRIDDIVPS